MNLHTLTNLYWKLSLAFQTRLARFALAACIVTLIFVALVIVLQVAGHGSTAAAVSHHLLADSGDPWP